MTAAMPGNGRDVALARLIANPATCPVCGGATVLAPFWVPKGAGGRVEWLLVCRRWDRCAEVSA